MAPTGARIRICRYFKRMLGQYSMSRMLIIMSSTVVTPTALTAAGPVRHRTTGRDLQTRWRHIE